MILRNFTLLYVEDDQDTQKAMKAILEDEVKIFYQAYNGEEGLALYKEKKPDIVLTDINMPGMSGLNMALAIKNIDKTQHIAITSAFDEKNILLDAINIGIDSFMVKPVDIDILIEKLEHIAQHLLNHIDTEKARNEARKKKEKKLYELAHYDTLTSIPNRFLFHEKLKSAMNKLEKEKCMTALFFIDLDDFKIINDSYGHKAGDYVLINFVNNIKKSIRKNDTFARIGGDEFAIIIENFSSKESLKNLAKKIIEVVSIPVVFDNNSLQISCSIGISIGYEKNIESETLIHHADIAMYQAKAKGKSNFVFYDR